VSPVRERFRKADWRRTLSPVARSLRCGPKANPGRGSNHSRKHRGKTAVREMRVPKQQTNDPIHHVTTANMSRDSCSSGRRLPADHHLAPMKPITTARTNRAEPLRNPGSGFAFRDLHSKKIRAALMGRIKNMCEYALFRSANPNVAMRVCRHRTGEGKHRRTKLRYGDDGPTSRLCFYLTRSPSGVSTARSRASTSYSR